MTATTVTVSTVIALTDHLLLSGLFHHAVAMATPVPGSDEPLRDTRVLVVMRKGGHEEER